jgi:YebC/PmpR family DNA-binding regulatory protein
MSGHSHWATIKRQKGAQDAKRGKVFTKLAREITAAAREGLPDPDFNPRLRLAVQKAKYANMPVDNIDRAIKRATGAGDGAALNEVVYEGYAPGGAAVLVQALTDNKNRTTAEVRTQFNHNNGAMVEAGAVTWIFDRKGIVVVEGENDALEELSLEAIDAGADDVKVDAGVLEIQTAPENLEAVRKAMEAKGANITSADVSLLPKTSVDLDEKAATQTMRLLERLEDLDDVQQVYTNANFPQVAVEQ